MKKVLSLSLSIMFGVAVLLPGVVSAAGTLSLSQTSVSLSPGAQTTVTAFVSSGELANVSTVSNASVATAISNNNNVTIYAYTAGTSQIVVCTSDNTCGTIFVSVGGNGFNFNSGSSEITFSQNNLSLTSGQSYQVTAFSNEGGSMFVSANTNPSAVSASISANSINIYALSSGSSTITVCDNFGNCGSLFVTVNGNGSNFNNTGLTFSQSNPFLTSGQSMQISIYGNSQFNSGYFVSSNSNSSVLSASISGNILNLYGLSSGSSTVVVCQSGSICGSVFVTVNGFNSGSNGTITLSQTSVELSYGSYAYITVESAYNNSFYLASNPNSSVVTASLSGNTLTLRGLNTGTDDIMVCSISENQCATVVATVNGGNTNTVGNISFSQSAVYLSSNQSTNVTIYSNNGYATNFYLATNSNPSVATASVTADTLYLVAENSGTSNINVCQISGSCASLTVTVNLVNNMGGLSFSQTSLPSLTVGQYYSNQLVVSGGSAPYTFTVISGALPVGLSMTPSGFISGVPQSTASSAVTIQAQDLYGHTASQTYTFSAVGSGAVLGASIYPNGALVNDSGTIYLIYKNTKSGFANFASLVGLGYNSHAIVAGSTESLVPSGFTIGSANIAHPWGSWIKDGGTIYFVSDQGLIPVPDWNTFISNGGNPALVVNANQFDFGKYLLSPMTLNDSRLQ